MKKKVPIMGACPAQRFRLLGGCTEKVLAVAVCAGGGFTYFVSVGLVVHRKGS